MRNLKKILSMLCPDMVSEVHDVFGRPCVITPLYYPNGDSINIYFNRIGNKVEATDEGSTADYLEQGGISMSGERGRVASSICDQAGALFSHLKISKIIRTKSVGEDVLSLCQAITGVASIYHYIGESHQSPERSKLPASIENLIEKKVASARNISRHWVNTEIDPKGSFPVDYHFNGEAPPRDLFYVTNTNKALFVTAVVHFLRSHNIVIPTMAVVDKNAEIKGAHIDRLQFASDKIVFGIKGNEKAIAGFVLGKSFN